MTFVSSQLLSKTRSLTFRKAMTLGNWGATPAHRLSSLPLYLQIRISTPVSKSRQCFYWPSPNTYKLFHVKSLKSH